MAGTTGSLFTTNEVIGDSSKTMPLEMIASGTVGDLYRSGLGVTDVDGNTYTTIIINGMEWMAENLRTSTYANGESIPNVTDGWAWSDLTTGAWAHFRNDSQYEHPYGKLYNWYAVSDPRKLCPSGWHVPTDREWSYLESALGMPDSELWQEGYRGSRQNVGGKMKAKNLWKAPNEGATNESGFSGLPGGYRVLGDFHNFGNRGCWWSARQTNAWHAWYWNLSYDLTGSSRQHEYKTNGHSVRCVKN
jgi:uncharacterized protein (TIGR02145 family)